MISSYVGSNEFWQFDEDPMAINPLFSAIQSVVINKGTNQGETIAYPMRSSDGSLSAEVTYWGAIGAGCEHVDIAYDFLRQFLSEEVQWEMRWGRNWFNLVYSRLITGYPVRTVDSVGPMTTYVTNLAYRLVVDTPEYQERWEILEPVALTDSDFPILDAEIDYVRFPLSWEVDFWFARKDLVDFFNGCQPADVDLDEVAKELHQQLVYHVAES